MDINQSSFENLLGELTSIEEKNSPKQCFYSGKISLLTEGRRVAVVGSRKVSDNGLIRTDFLCEALVRHQIIIVSGLAEGVDTMAHKSAIKYQGKTISVLGTPLSQAYPRKTKSYWTL